MRDGKLVVLLSRPSQNEHRMIKRVAESIGVGVRIGIHNTPSDDAFDETELDLLVFPGDADPNLGVFPLNYGYKINKDVNMRFDLRKERKDVETHTSFDLSVPRVGFGYGALKLFTLSGGLLWNSLIQGSNILVYPQTEDGKRADQTVASLKEPATKQAFRYNPFFHNRVFFESDSVVSGNTDAASIQFKDYRRRDVILIDQFNSLCINYRPSFQGDDPIDTAVIEPMIKVIFEEKLKKAKVA